MMLSFSEFSNCLLSDKYDNIYIFAGQEDFFHKEGVLLLRKKLKVPNFSWHIVYADETSLQYILEIIYSAPLFSKTNVVQLCNLSFTCKNYKEQLVNVLTKNFPQNTIVILHLKTKEPIFTKLKAKWVNCQLTDAKLLPNLLVTLCKEKFNKNLTIRAAVLLCDLLRDCDILTLEKEIEKLSTFVGKEEQIDEESVLQLIAALNKDILNDLEKLLKDNTLPELHKIKSQEATKLLSSLTHLLIRRNVEYDFYKLWRQLRLLSLADVKLKTTSSKLHEVILALYLFKLSN